MVIEEKKIIYDDNFFTTKSGDNTLKINDSKDVASSKHYYPIGKLQKDENYIFDHAYNPMYCTSEYPGCHQCVGSCVNCQGGCQTSCQNTCYAGCVSGCTNCQGCQGGCNSGCTSSCQSCVGGCDGGCQTSCTSCQGDY